MKRARRFFALCVILTAFAGPLSAQGLTHATMVGRATGGSEHAKDRATRVLLLYAPAPESPTAATFIENLQVTVRRDVPGPLEFYVEYLDFDRFPSPQRELQLARYFREKYEGFPIDVVIPVGSAALNFTLERLPAVFLDVPVVFALAFAHGVNVSALPQNVTGRLITISFDATVALARRLQPDAERVMLVTGASAIDSAALAAALVDFAPMRDSIPFVLRQGLPYAKLLADLRAVSPKTIVFFVYFRRDGLGQLFVPLEVLHTIARESRAPVYGYVDKMLGEGIVGGAVIHYDEEAIRTGSLAARVLRRPSRSPMPAVEYARTSFTVDWRQLQRWRLDERRLPPGTHVLFRESTIWERYRGPIVLAAVLLVAQSILIVSLLIERDKRKLAQLSIEEQAAYERTIAELTTDAVRYTAEEAPRALHDALARMGRYAGASAAVLVELSDTDARAPSRLYWARGHPASNGNGNGRSADAAITSMDAERLDLPLVVAGSTIGALELYRANDGHGWPRQRIGRLPAAAEVIAGALNRARSERRAEDARRQVAHMGRVAMVGELAATISHELRQPLAAIRSNAEVGAELLARTPPDLEEVRQILAEIVDDDVRASATVDEIRSLLRKEEPTTTHVQINDVCRHAVEFLQRDAARRNVRFQLSLDSDLPPIIGNPVQLQQVVLNLALNAIDAVERSAGKREVIVGTARGDIALEVFVRDSGPGLSGDVQSRLFESFFSTKEHGLGMGLVIVRSVVERHRGRVYAENCIAGGAVFRVILPIP